MTDNDWKREAACRGKGHLFFQRAEPGCLVDYSTALALCAVCPVRFPQCWDHAIAHGDIVDGKAVHGAVAGVAPREGEPVKIGRPPTRQGHGTSAGYKRHKRNGEEACALCRRANALDARERKEARKSA